MLLVPPSLEFAGSNDIAVDVYLEARVGVGKGGLRLSTPVEGSGEWSP